jgi:hypothetical protein
LVSDYDFYEFLRGLSDGESNFQITQDKIGKCKFKFKFRIGMHLNDRPLLVYIRNRLGIGKIFPLNTENITPGRDKLVATREVYSFEELLKIINIFDNHPLNTTKQLDYLVWREAYFLYTINNEEGKLDLNILDQILNLKNSMNNKRNNFIQSSLQKFNVTPYWLLGLIEGEGSFFVTKKILTQHFELSLIHLQKPVLEEVYKFLMSIIPNDMKNFKGLENPIQLIDKNLSYKASMCVIKISHMAYISKIFIPFLVNLTFFSKKENSFTDWKSLALIKLSGKHLTSLGKTLCNALSNRMNDWTYFTDNGISNRLAAEQLDLQIQQLLSDTSVIIDKNRGGYVKIQILDDQAKSFSSPMSKQEVADFFHVSIKTISRRLVDGKPLVHQNRNFYIQHVVR